METSKLHELQYTAIAALLMFTSAVSLDKLATWYQKHTSSPRQSIETRIENDAHRAPALFVQDESRFTGVSVFAAAEQELQAKYRIPRPGHRFSNFKGKQLISEEEIRAQACLRSLIEWKSGDTLHLGIYVVPDLNNDGRFGNLPGKPLPDIVTYIRTLDGATMILNPLPAETAVWVGRERYLMNQEVGICIQERNEPCPLLRKDENGIWQAPDLWRKGETVGIVTPESQMPALWFSAEYTLHPPLPSQGLEVEYR